MLTKTAAFRAARNQLRFGYFHPLDSKDYSINCPRCKKPQTTQLHTRWKAVPKGRSHSQVINGQPCALVTDTIRFALLRVLVEHLTQECDAAA